MKKIEVFFNAFTDEIVDSVVRIGLIFIGCAAIIISIHFAPVVGWILVGVFVSFATFKGWVAVVVTNAREKAAERMSDKA